MEACNLLCSKIPIESKILDYVFQNIFYKLFSSHHNLNQENFYLLPPISSLFKKVLCKRSKSILFSATEIDSNKTFYNELVKNCQAGLLNGNHIIRISCLSIFSILIDTKFCPTVWIIETLQNYLRDDDCRVRLHLLSNVLSNNSILSKINGKPLKELIAVVLELISNDTNSAIRLSSILMLSNLANTFPSMRVVSNAKLGKMPLSLVAFIAFCDGVNDNCHRVRCEALKALGRIGPLLASDEETLLQTLSKQTIVIVSHDKKPSVSLKSDGGSKKFKFAKNEHAAGAFVHGLEDEFVWVRLQAVGNELLSLVSYSYCNRVSCSHQFIIN